MKGKGLIDEHSFVELRVKYYMQCLLVETPEEVMHYLEKRIQTYRCRLENSEMYPRIVVTNIMRLIKEYSLDMIQVKKYMNDNKKVRLKNISTNKREKTRK